MEYLREAGMGRPGTQDTLTTCSPDDMAGRGLSLIGITTVVQAYANFAASTISLLIIKCFASSIADLLLIKKCFASSVAHLLLIIKYFASSVADSLPIIMYFASLFFVIFQPTAIKIAYYGHKPR